MDVLMRLSRWPCNNDFLSGAPKQDLDSDGRMSGMSVVSVVSVACESSVVALRMRPTGASRWVRAESAGRDGGA